MNDWRGMLGIGQLSSHLSLLFGSALPAAWVLVKVEVAMPSVVASETLVAHCSSSSVVVVAAGQHVSYHANCDECYGMILAVVAAGRVYDGSANRDVVELVVAAAAASWLDETLLIVMDNLADHPGGPS